MTWPKELLFRLRNLFRKDQADAELDEEIRLHIDLQTEAYVASGMTAEEARQRARKEFGNVVRAREDSRDERSFVWLEQWLRDLRFACVSLRRAPIFSLGVIATLAIGIGVTSAILSIAWSSYRISAPPNDRDVDFTELLGVPENRLPSLNPWRFAAYAKATQSFERLGATKIDSTYLVFDGQPYEVGINWITKGVEYDPPEFGRNFSPAEFKEEEQVEVAILGHETWVRFFGKDPSIIGKDVIIANRLRRIIGIQKSIPGIPGISREEPMVIMPVEWLPVDPNSAKFDYSWLFAQGRLKPGVTIAQAKAELAGLKISNSGNHYFDTAEPSLSPTDDPDKKSSFSKSLPLFVGASCFLYAIACTIAINLVLARALSRRHELGVRLALGGSRWQIMRPLLAESAILSICAGSAGVLIAHGCGSFVCGYLPVSGGVSFSYAPLGIVIILVSFTTMIIGFVPAWRSGKVSPIESIKTGSASLGTNRHLKALGESFVIIQTTLVVILLAGAGLMLKSISRLNRTGVGFDPSSKISVNTLVPWGTPLEKYLGLATCVRNELAALPRVKAVSFNSGVPLGGTSVWSFKLIEHPEYGSIRAHGSHISPEFFSLVGIQLIKGRGFSGVRTSDPYVVIVNEALEKKYFPKEGAIGKYLDIGEKIEIIGVVNDTRESGPKEVVLPTLYVPVNQQRFPVSMCWLIQLPATRVPNLEALVRRTIYKIDPTLFVNVTSLEDTYNQSISTERFTLVLLQVFSVLALVLASLGLFSVMAYNVAQRRGEFGLRMALGATPDDLLRSVLGRGLRTVGIGIVIGLGLAFFLTRFLQSLLYQTSPLDPLTYSVVVCLLLAVALLACWLPARKAALTDPMTALRCE